jgi:predicted transcriptional regulator of viral defense system
MALGFGVGGGVFGSEFYGISETGIDAAKDTILDLSKTVKDTLDEFADGITEDTMAQAVKGTELATALKNFVEAVKKEAQEWSTHMLAYCTALDEVKEQYQTNKTEASSSLDTSSSDVSSQADEYTYSGGSASSAS